MAASSDVKGKVQKPGGGAAGQHVIKVDGVNHRLQLLWRVAGLFDHVHLGIRRA